MPNHPDAIGYLNDLANEVGEPWFKMVCDLAVGGGSSLDQNSCDTLFAIFTKRASYLPIQPSVSTAPQPAGTATPDFLGTLSGFLNFKLLEPTLELTFTKRITLVFGANGSGKSSICESMKVLASPEAPSRPLYNVRSAVPATPVFSYKFRSDARVQSWNPSVGYGPRSVTVKYFDSGVALSIVESAVEPGRVVVLTPYKLHVFEWTKALTSEFRSVLQEARETNAKNLADGLEKIRAEFSKFKNCPLAALDEKNASSLSAEIKIGEAFDQSKLLQEKQNAAAALEKAASEEGLKLLRAEHRELEAFLSSVGVLIGSAESLWSLQPATKGRDLLAKQTAQELLAKALIPENGTLDELVSLVRAASPLCNLESAEHEVCPLCRRELKSSEADLFKKYHELLTGRLEEEIASLRADLHKAREVVEAVHHVNREEWDKYSTLPADLLQQAKTSSGIVLESCDLGDEPANEAMEALEALKNLASNGAQLVEQKSNAIDIAAKGRGELVRALEKIHVEIEPLAYAQAIASYLVPLKEAHRRAAEAELWGAMLPSFTPLLKKITDRAKETHRRLVVSDFEARLNAEYKALTEKPMAAFGVTLENRGSEALVTLLPQVGGKEIDDILSEGEQRVHAMALFFAELETCSQSVIVFDDPVSSFDYNFVANYCARLRDFAVNHPERQIIVLTHNWDFFVQLQLTLNKSGLNNNLSVQVLENCAVVADYSEKVHERKADISSLLTATSEPSRAEKEELAGKMRRLSESVVNTHVFNNQRHQFKQKSLPVTDFPQFTKLTPLLSSEAVALGDLYAKLSISEHDDPRNAYVNTDKATFQSRYDSILAIETAVIARKQR